MKKLKTKPYLLISLGGALILFVAFLAYSEVDNSLTAEDHLYIAKYLEDIPAIPANRTYENEIDIIIQIQNSVLSKAAHKNALPLGAKREPKDLFTAKAGLCYDRSRVIEKILRSIGFKTRHVSIYSTKQTHSSIKSLLTPGVASHAVTEVLTQKGWLVVDSNHRWVSMDSKNNPISMAQIRLSAAGAADIAWNQIPPNKKYMNPFIYVYGLYSRHGQFYPPYNFIPDVNYRELVSNIL
ncbi:MAG: transglutaminase domain-containing protein [Nitrospinota bacterium]|nr:transglutaminase domain-containing protein [Nitrospinota bacterium]